MAILFLRKNFILFMFRYFSVWLTRIPTNQLFLISEIPDNGIPGITAFVQGNPGSRNQITLRI